MLRDNPFGNVPPTDANLNSISLEYSFLDLSRASRNFAQSQLLGKGSYGAVFRGILKDGTEVAIKVLNNPKDSGFKEEVLVLSKFRHPNLVILMGFSRNGKDRYLVYELLPGADLCSRLQKDPGFDWRKRMNACLDASLGLSHLHNASPKVFHRDIKTQNILLDRNGTAKMADFGLALLAQPKTGIKVQQCSGTLGYADPLYISSSVVTERSEVYSFGMVLLEVLTGRPPAVQNPVNGQVQYVYAHIRGDVGAIMSMVQWKAGWPSELAQRVARLALACIDSCEANRPVFVDIVARLRDLVSRSDSFSKMVTRIPVVNQNIPPRQPVDNSLLQKQAQLEEALKRLHQGQKSYPPVITPVEKWNPFDLSDDDHSVDPKEGRKVVVNVPDNPKTTIRVEEDAKEDSKAETTPQAENPQEEQWPEVNKAVAALDDELRQIASSRKSEDVEKAMNALFPSSESTVGTPQLSEEKEDKQKREVAKHLLAAGFTLDQIQRALQRSRSVEAAVEWIVEQQWD